MTRYLPKSSLIEAALILLIATILGFGMNAINPRKAAISAQRPAAPAVSDSVLAKELPEIRVSDSGATSSSLPDKITNSPIIVNTAQVRQLIARHQVLLLDARSEEEHAAGFIPGSLNLPFENLFNYQDQVQALPHDRWLVCYCDGPPCDLGELLAQELVNTGFTRVAFYEAGFDEWKKSESSEPGRSDVHNAR